MAIDDGPGHITKQGSSKMHFWLVEAAQVSLLRLRQNNVASLLCHADHADLFIRTPRGKLLSKTQTEKRDIATLKSLRFTHSMFTASTIATGHAE